MTNEQHVVTVAELDDGIWLECSCGWSRNIGFGPTGFGPTVPEVVSAWEEHRSEWEEQRTILAGSGA